MGFWCICIFFFEVSKSWDLDHEANPKSTQGRSKAPPPLQWPKAREGTLKNVRKPRFGRTKIPWGPKSGEWGTP
jgi:hypothetical protein